MPGIMSGINRDVVFQCYEVRAAETEWKKRQIEKPENLGIHPTACDKLFCASPSQTSGLRTAEKPSAGI